MGKPLALTKQSVAQALLAVYCQLRYMDICLCQMLHIYCNATFVKASENI